MPVSDDLRAEGEDLYQLLKDKDASVFEQKTGFKDWTVRDVIAHLHLSDAQGLASANGAEAFREEIKPMMAAMKEGKGLIDYTRDWAADWDGPAVFTRWRETFVAMCDAFDALEPDARLKWFGPDMGLRMFATARQMETWAHASEIYDLLGVSRTETDRVRNVVAIGVKTYGWTFVNRQREVPEPMPHVKLTAPSGDVWEYGEPDSGNLIEGSAVEFAQVVTQTRNIADTSLKVEGPIAIDWMSIAQAFAGPPEDPPAPGARGPKS